MKVSFPQLNISNSPELFEEDVAEQSDRYSKKVDVYSFGVILTYIVSDKYPPFSLRNTSTGKLPTLPSTIVPWVVELIGRCLQLSPNDRPTFNAIFEVLKSHDFDLFNETKPTKPTMQQRKMKAEIEQRILKIEAFEYQHRL